MPHDLASTRRNLLVPTQHVFRDVIDSTLIKRLTINRIQEQRLLKGLKLKVLMQNRLYNFRGYKTPRTSV